MERDIELTNTLAFGFYFSLLNEFLISSLIFASFFSSYHPTYGHHENQKDYFYFCCFVLFFPIDFEPEPIRLYPKYLMRRYEMRLSSFSYIRFAYFTQFFICATEIYIYFCFYSYENGSKRLVLFRNFILVCTHKCVFSRTSPVCI